MPSAQRWYLETTMQLFTYLFYDHMQKAARKMLDRDARMYVCRVPKSFL